MPTLFQRIYRRISDLADVLLGTLSDGDVLTYDATSGKWKNEQPETADLSGYYTGSYVDGLLVNKANLVHTHSTSSIIGLDAALNSKIDTFIPDTDNEVVVIRTTGAIDTSGVQFSNIAQLAASQTLTNKIISGSSNTLSNIAQSSVTNLVTDLASKAPTANPTFTGMLSSGVISAGATASTVATFTSSNTISRVKIDNVTASPNVGLQLLENGVAKWVMASYDTGKFTFYNETVGAEALGITAGNVATFRDNGGVVQFQTGTGGTFCGALGVVSGQTVFNSTTGGGLKFETNGSHSLVVGGTTRLNAHSTGITANGAVALNGVTTIVNPTTATYGAVLGSTTCPIIANVPGSHVGNGFEYRKDGFAYFTIGPYGGIYSIDVCMFGGGDGGSQFNCYNNGLASRHVMKLRGGVSQTGDLIRAENSGGTSLFTVNASGYMNCAGVTAGSIYSPYLEGDSLYVYYDITADGSISCNSISTAVIAVNQRLTCGVYPLTDGATINTNAQLGNTFTVTIAGNRTMAAPTNPYSGQKILYQVKQDGTGSRTLTWNAAFRFSGGVAPTLTTTAAKTDYIEFHYNAVDSKWDCIRFNSNY